MNDEQGSASATPIQAYWVVHLMTKPGYTGELTFLAALDPDLAIAVIRDYDDGARYWCAYMHTDAEALSAAIKANTDITAFDFYGVAVIEK